MDHKDHDWDTLLAEAQKQERRQRSFYTAKEFGPVMHTLICEKHWTLADTCRWIIDQGFNYSAANLRLGYELWLEKNPEKRSDLPSYFRPLAKRERHRQQKAP